MKHAGSIIGLPFSLEGRSCAHCSRLVPSDGDAWYLTRGYERSFFHFFMEKAFMVVVKAIFKNGGAVLTSWVFCYRSGMDSDRGGQTTLNHLQHHENP